MNDLIGWIGSLVLSLSGIPQIYKIIKTKSAGDISIQFMAMWAGGLILLLIHTLNLDNYSIPLVANYALSAFVCIATIAVTLKYRRS